METPVPLWGTLVPTVGNGRFQPMETIVPYSGNGCSQHGKRILSPVFLSLHPALPVVSEIETPGQSP